MDRCGCREGLGSAMVRVRVGGGSGGGVVGIFFWCSALPMFVFYKRFATHFYCSLLNDVVAAVMHSARYYCALHCETKQNGQLYWLLTLMRNWN